MLMFGKIAAAATAVVCAVALVVSIYPGWLNDLLSMAILLCLFVTPIILVVVAVVVITLYRRRSLHFDRTTWKCVALIAAMLFVTFIALRFYVPRRIPFAWCRTSFQQIVDNGLEEDHEFNRTIGPYFVDECLTDERGGAYFRVYSGADGIGPDVMSYGFCYKPNNEGSPFGAAHYRTFQLGDNWHWFRASDDWH